jgi:hypothetical protein
LRTYSGGIVKVRIQLLAVCSLVIACLSACAVQVEGQATTASIHGTVTDSTGAIVSNATVTVVNTSSGISITQSVQRLQSRKLCRSEWKLWRRTSFRQHQFRRSAGKFRRRSPARPCNSACRKVLFLVARPGAQRTCSIGFEPILD